MTKKYWVTLLLAGIAAYGCSEDSINVNGEPKTCQNNDDCKPDVCVEGKCQPASGDPCTGEDCPQTCTGEDCTQTCTGDDCKQNQPVELNEGDDCVKGATDRICKSPLVCTNGKCKPKSAPHSDSCSSDTDCAAKDADHQTCLPDGRCGKYVNKGDECDEDEAVLCSGDLKCYDLACKELLSLNDACGTDLDQICDPEQDLECINDTCLVKEILLKKGATCNDSYLLCAPDLTCYASNPDQPEDRKCARIVGENEECDESDNIFCSDNLYCKSLTTKTESGEDITTQTCQPLGKTCEISKDCTEKDSYCCTSETDCSEVEYKHCIPFDEKHDHDDMCLFTTKPGVFEAQIQCRWQPAKDPAHSEVEQYLTSTKVEMPPLVGPFGNSKGLETVVAFFSYDQRLSAPKSNQLLSVIRFIDPTTCETLESVRYDLIRHAMNMPGAADLDNDGLMEFITFNSLGHVVAFKWNKESKKHELMWENSLAGADNATTSYHTPKNYYILTFDVNSDGLAEVIVGNTVINGQDGTTIFEGGDLSSQNGAIGYFDGDTAATLVTHKYVYKWDKASNNKWNIIAKLPEKLAYKAFADFGTPGPKKTKEDFDYKSFDGFPEIVAGGSGKLHLYTLVPNPEYPTTGYYYNPVSLMDVKGFDTGGPITVGDFDSDGLPEIGVASKGLFGVYDPLCKEYEAGKCADENVLWERWSQDASSGATGSSLFDFDGDGQAEAVYADECFTRVYEGKTGKVLFSSKRSSGTSYEAPVVADIDNDGSAEIMMGSDNNHACYSDDHSKTYDPMLETVTALNCVDPIHEGIRCVDNSDCPTNNCKDGLCRCTKDSECNTQYVVKDGKKTLITQYVCAPPIDPEVGMMANKDKADARTIVKELGTRPAKWNEKTDKVCRATRKTTDIGIADLMIFKDRLDRWVDSRNVWNQHAYNIINVKDNGQVPNTAEWLKKFTETMLDQYIEGTTTPRPKYNNYRLNEQGKYGAGKAPDITGRFITDSVCGTTTNKEGNRVHVISGKLCNRGTKPVGYNLPATFFYYKEDGDHQGEKICTSYTDFIVGTGECYQVGCELSDEDFEKIIGKKVLMVSNLNEIGKPSTIECNENNNTDTIVVERCDSDILIDN